ncbi:MAG: hypothetical protein Q9219_004716 [cf. Caloplaca sp. 3 TL-2023]
MAPWDSAWVKTDAARERELFRYFEPPEITSEAPRRATHSNLSIRDYDPLTANAPSSPETTLTALAQLCALRLNASRAMVSLIGKETQYFIAEATKTLDLVDNQNCDEEGDALWFGCGSVDKSGRLCEKTIELPAKPDAYACFTVTDLTSDERFNKLPFVTGPPNFRFYAGTPLTSKNGINIGSLFILDDKVRPHLTPAQERFLGTIAATIMGHLEVNREAEERRKVLRMAQGLNAFVEGKSSFDMTDRSGDGFLDRPDDAPYDTESTYDNIEGAHKATFSRAASLLSASLNLHDHGGVCFLDTIIGPRNTEVRRTERKALDTESESDAKESPSRHRREPQRDKTDDQADSKSAEVISSSCTKKAGKSSEQFVPPEERFIQSLLKHYPRGKVWIFDGVDGLTSEEDEVSSLHTITVEEKGRRRLSRKQLESETLRKCFPNGESENIA